MLKIAFVTVVAVAVYLNCAAWSADTLTPSSINALIRIAPPTATSNVSFFRDSTNTTYDFLGAMQMCHEHGLTLASLKDQEELDVIVKDNFPLYYWIGLWDMVEEGVYRWVDDGTELDITQYTATPLFGQENGFQAENCMAQLSLFYNHKWTDVNCSIALLPLCQDRKITVNCV